MYALPVPPKETMGTKPRKLQEIMFYYSMVQYEMLKNSLEEFESEEFKELTSDEKAVFEEVFNTQLESYNQMQVLISDY